MKGFKVGLTILLNCKDSEVFKSLNNPLTVNDLFKGLGVINNKKLNTVEGLEVMKDNALNTASKEVFGGDGGLKILNHFSAEEIRSFRAEFSKENKSSSKLNPSPSPEGPSAQGQGQGSGSPQQLPR